MAVNEDTPAYKLFLKDLCNLEKDTNGLWWYNFSQNPEAKISIFRFKIQGRILKITGLNNEILIISDNTAKAKVTRGPQVPGDFSWLKTGIYCSVIGMLVDCGKLPHIAVIKLADLSYNPVLEKMWPIEVLELKNFLSGKIIPDLTLMEKSGLKRKQMDISSDDSDT